MSLITAIFGALVVAACGGVARDATTRSETPPRDGGFDGEDGGSVAGGRGGTRGRGGGGGRPPVGGRRATGGAALGGASAGGASNGGAGAEVNGGASSELYVCLRGSGTAGAAPQGTAAEGEACCGDRGICTSVLQGVDGPLPAGFVANECEPHEGLACAPKPGGFARVCHVDLGSVLLEGRCLDRCFAQPDQEALFEGSVDCLADGGGPSTVCIPCYDPFWANRTPVCMREGDQPVEPQPSRPPCGAAAAGPAMGRCVPGSVSGLLGFDSTFVPRSTCSPGELCVPEPRLGNSSTCFASCNSTVGPGVCTPDYIVGHFLPGRVETLGRGTCDGGETCAPCSDPEVGGVTGLCSR